MKSILTAAVVVTVAMAPVVAPTSQAPRWVASWASAVAEPLDFWDDGDWGYLSGGFADQTLRHTVHTSVGGEAVRVTLSNYFGAGPLRVDAATVAVSAQANGGSAAVAADSLTALTFGGQPGVTVPSGQIVTSDAVELAVPQDHDLAVDLYFPTPTGTPNGHLWATQTSHVGPGDLTGDASGTAFRVQTTSSYYLTAVDVLSDTAGGSVVVLGDSLSDGILAIAPDSGQKWSDRVFDRLAGGGPARLGVVNVAVAGNALQPLSDPNSALARFDRDVLARSGVTTVVVLLGTNDIGSKRTSDEIVDGLRQLIDRAHAAGVRIVGATIPPVTGPADGSCPMTAPAIPDDEQTRQAANARIRPGSPGSLRFDAVVDFDAVLRNPADHSRIQCVFASFGNNFHPNPAGHQAMGDAVDLDALGNLS